MLSISKIMYDNNLDVIVVTDRYNMNYLSGYMGDTGMLLFVGDMRYLFTDSRYIEVATRDAVGFECVDIAKKGYAESILAKLIEYEITTDTAELNVGFEDNSISYKQYKTFEDKWLHQGHIRLTPIGDALDRLRQIKTIDEQKKIAKAEEIGDKAFSHIINFIKSGMTEKEVALELEVTMKRLGAEGLSFDTIVASGPNSSMPHAVPTDRRLQPGDFVTMDFGCIYNGYCSDMTRTIFIADEDITGPTAEQRLVYDTVLHAQQEAMNHIKPGMKCYDIDKIARDIIAKAGYGDYFGHGLGHSVGLFIHEEPRLSPSCDDILKEGMVVTVEPGIYLPGRFGVRIENLVLVTEDGYRDFTSSERELILLKS